MKNIAVGFILSLLTIGQAYSQTSKSANTNNHEDTQEKEHYTFKLSDKVTRQKVTFKNRYGITLAGDLYLPKDSGNQTFSSTCYQWSIWCGKRTIFRACMQIRWQNVVLLPLHLTHLIQVKAVANHEMASPDINTEDFSAAVDFLVTKKC